MRHEIERDAFWDELDRRGAAVLTFLVGAAALGWTVVALSVHATDPTGLDPDSVTDADLARLGAGVMAVIAAVAAGLWWRHGAALRRPVIGGGWARAVCGRQQD